MSDQGFDFRPPPERREAKQFEPPPWEMAQFEELQKRKEAAEAEARAAEEAADAAAAAAAETEAAAVASGPGDAAGDAAPVAVVSQVRPEEGASGPAGPVPAPGPDAEAATAELGQVDEKQFAAMLLELRNEEPPALRGAWKVTIGAGFVSAVLGVVLAVWGVAGFLTVKRTGATGALGGMVLLFFGLGFTGVGAWLVFKTLREQGVL